MRAEVARKLHNGDEVFLKGVSATVLGFREESLGVLRFSLLVGNGYVEAYHDELEAAPAKARRPHGQ